MVGEDHVDIRQSRNKRNVPLDSNANLIYKIEQCLLHFMTDVSACIAHSLHTSVSFNNTKYLMSDCSSY